MDFPGISFILIFCFSPFGFSQEQIHIDNLKKFNISSTHNEGIRNPIPIIQPQKQYEAAVDLAVAQLIYKKWSHYTPQQFLQILQKIHKTLLGFNQDCISRCMSVINEDNCHSLTNDAELCRLLPDLLAGKIPDEKYQYFATGMKEHKEKCAKICSEWSPELEYHGLVAVNNSWPHEGIWRQVPITITSPFPDPLDPLSMEGTDEFIDCKAYAEYRISEQELIKNRKPDFLNNCKTSRIQTPHPKYVHAQMLNFADTILTMERERVSTQKIAAYAHQNLVRIHPFFDGNGRMARLLANIILVKHRVAPVDFKNQCPYSKAVVESMRQKDITATFQAKCLEQTAP